MNWIRIFGSVQEAKDRIPENKPFTVAIDSRKICLLRNGQEFFAFSAFCPHAGAYLSEAFCNNKGEIVCPLHTHRYDLRTGQETTGHAEELVLYPLLLKEEGLFVGLKQ